MDQVPDAPYIREAEMNGMPSPEPVFCPVCGKECEMIYRDRNGGVCGCEKCIEEQESWEWKEEEQLASRPEWVDEC